MSGSFSKAGAALVLWVLSSAAVAAGDAPALKSDHPDRYIVQKGDTLWDISGRFLAEPWRWPDVWQVNPQIENPHLIYPGDELYLTYADGRPIIRMRRGVVRLSPRVRREALADAIPTIPVDAIQQFLMRPRVVTDAEFNAAPYLLSFGKEALLGRPGAKVYARGIADASQTRYTVYRRGRVYVDPGDGEEVLGYEALHVADAVLDAAGDPSTLILTSVEREVQIGDRLVPVDEDQIYQAYMPRPADPALAGQIISVVDGVSQIGQFQTVVINLGTKHGLEPGHVFAVYQRGEVVEDPLAKDPVLENYDRRAQERIDNAEKDGPFGVVQGIGYAVETVGDAIGRDVRRFSTVGGNRPWAEVTLPEERAGTILVYRPFERLSYALVMKATRAMHILDSVKHP